MKKIAILFTVAMSIATGFSNAQRTDLDQASIDRVGKPGSDARKLAVFYRTGVNTPTQNKLEASHWIKENDRTWRPKSDREFSRQVASRIASTTLFPS